MLINAIYASPEEVGAPVAESTAPIPPPEATPPAESASTETGKDSVPAEPEQTATETTEEPAEFSMQIGDKVWTESELKRQIPNFQLTQSAYDRQQARMKSGEILTLEQAHAYIADKLGTQQQVQPEETYDTPETTEGVSKEADIDQKIADALAKQDTAMQLRLIESNIAAAVTTDGSPYKGLDPIEVDHKMAEMLEAGLWDKDNPASVRQATDIALQEVNIATRKRHETFLASEAGQALIKEKYGPEILENYNKTKEAPPTLPPGGATEAPKPAYKPGELGAMSSEEFIEMQAAKALD